MIDKGRIQTVGRETKKQWRRNAIDAIFEVKKKLTRVERDLVKFKQKKDSDFNNAKKRE